MQSVHQNPTIENDGWTLLSAEQRAALAPDMFSLPTKAEREALSVGAAAKLLFDIETRSGGKVVDRGTERMWVIVKSRREKNYVGVLDNNPGGADNLNLHAGDLILFGPEHICEIGKPPRDYIVEKYGTSFF